MSVDPTALSSLRTGLPPVNEAVLPADVRSGTKAQKQAYQAALGFERMLVGELTKSMLATSQSDDSSSDATTAMYKQMLPEQLADSVTSAGGIGLAQQLYRSVQGTPR